MSNDGAPRYSFQVMKICLSVDDKEMEKLYKSIYSVFHNRGLNAVAREICDLTKIIITKMNEKKDG